MTSVVTFPRNRFGLMTSIPPFTRFQGHYPGREPVTVCHEHLSRAQVYDNA
jgi:hypothetical protein